MKEFRLLAWPDLPPELRHTGHQRALSELSQRHLSLRQLVDASGLRKRQLRALLEFLERKGVLDQRDGGAPDSFLDSIGRLGWFRRSRPFAATTQTIR